MFSYRQDVSGLFVAIVVVLIGTANNCFGQEKKQEQMADAKIILKVPPQTRVGYGKLRLLKPAKLPKLKKKQPEELELGTGLIPIAKESKFEITFAVDLGNNRVTRNTMAITIRGGMTIEVDRRKEPETETIIGQLDAKVREQVYPFKLAKGVKYLIEMESSKFDTFMRLQDGQKKEINKAKGNPNSRIVFTPANDGEFRIIASSSQGLGNGAYRLSVREIEEQK